MADQIVTGRFVTGEPPLATHRSLPIALLRAREKVMEPIRGMLAEVGVTEQQWRVLRVLDECGLLEPSEVARHACLLLPSLSRITQALVDKGYIARNHNPRDRRSQLLGLTRRGQKLLDDHMAEALDIAQLFERKLGKDKMEQLLDLLDELNVAPF
ncbi:MAG: homoprotocatechuate degradation operon regulator HpaR [Methyloligellaceae bacterium]